MRGMERTIRNLEELHEEAKRLVSGLAPANGATLVTLSGELGAGKTTFTQAIAGVLGVEDIVTSPTFVLEKIYPLSSGTFSCLIHIDAYRLQSGADLAPLELSNLMKDPGNLIVLEWPERVADALPTPTVSIRLVPEADGSRTISYA